MMVGAWNPLNNVSQFRYASKAFDFAKIGLLSFVTDLGL
ncbi:hypothetical protein SAMN05444162_1258 [Paenibacillaceae bacterium GAS479]|nr:hypothetical protein SAMN05444162_1258 [Paenibacillaceae bacterium GAS479]